MGICCGTVCLGPHASGSVQRHLVLSFGGAWWLLTHGSQSPGWLPWAVGLGCLVHVAGDWPTRGGVPVPFTWFDGKSARTSLGLFKTGAPVEHVLALVFLVATGWLLWRHTGWTSPADVLAGL